jgi:predicted nucleic acid-binding protein
LRIVSNTSPIVALAHLGELDLRKIFDCVILIPPAVAAVWLRMTDAATGPSQNSGRISVTSGTAISSVFGP